MSSRNLLIATVATSFGLFASSRCVAQELKRTTSRTQSIRSATIAEQLTLQQWADDTAKISGEPVAMLNLDVQSNGSNSITVQPGATVPYQVIGELSNDAHQGLALFGLTLAFDGSELEPANHPSGVPTPGCDNPMINFERPWGITNPDTPCPPACGFAGTIIDGDLVQVGGGQNTNNNTIDNAPFPIGPVLLGVATPGACGPAELVTGSLTAPDTPGTYTLSIPFGSAFANVISPGEVCDLDPNEPATFCPVEAAGIGEVSDLVLHVVVCGGDDCQGNGIPDECEIIDGTSLDCDNNNIPDECESDCNANGVVDACDLSAHTSKDCNKNAIPDECDIANGTSQDIFPRVWAPDGIPDECQRLRGTKR